MTRRASPVASFSLLAVIAAVGMLAFLALGASGAARTAAPPAQGGADSGITVEYMGWSHYRLTSPSGKVVVTNPFITNNADAALTLDEAIARGADLIVVADAHPDEVGDTVALATGTGARVITSLDHSTTLVRRNGLPAGQLLTAGAGDTVRFEGITVNALNSVHGSGVDLSPSEPRTYGGIAQSYMITFENGFTIYFSGSSAATGDMAMWGEWYQPDAAILHQAAAHNPRDAAMVAKLISTGHQNLKTVFPHHHRLQPQPGGLFRPSDLRAEIQRLGVNVNFIEPEPLRPYTLTK